MVFTANEIALMKSVLGSKGGNLSSYEAALMGAFVNKLDATTDYKVTDDERAVALRLVSDSWPSGTDTEQGTLATKLASADSTGGLFVATNTPGTYVLPISASGMWGSTTTGATGPTKSELASNKVNLLTMDFADGAAKLYAEFNIPMPANWNAGTVRARFRWTANSTSTNSVVWGLQGVAVANDGTLDVAWGTAGEVTDANTSTASQAHTSDWSSAITIAGTPAAGKLVNFRVYRDPVNASDTLAATAQLIGVDVEYTLNTFSEV